jgi:hypothetical protein
MQSVANGGMTLTILPGSKRSILTQRRSPTYDVRTQLAGMLSRGASSSAASWLALYKVALRLQLLSAQLQLCLW